MLCYSWDSDESHRTLDEDDIDVRDELMSWIDALVVSR